MKNILYIWLLLPCLVWGQTIPDKKYYQGQEISKTYHGGIVVWSATPVVPTNYYALGDAADPYNETNTVSSGWELRFTGGTIASVAATGEAGSYAIEIVPAAQNSGRLLTFTGLTASTTYKISFYARSQNAANSNYGDFKVYPESGGTMNGSSPNRYAVFDNFTYTESHVLVDASSSTMTFSVTSNNDTWSAGEKLYIGWMKVEVYTP